MAKHKILVFGDEGQIFRTIGWVLNYRSYQVRLAPTQAVALTALIEQNYDIIITELKRGDLERLKVLKRAKDLNPEVKIMVVSGGGNAAFPLESYRIGVDDYLLMPISPSELWRRVSRCLESAPAPQSTSPGAAITTAATYDPGLDQSMLMLHDIRGTLVSTAAALKLIIRGTYGTLSPTLGKEFQEIYDRIQNLIKRSETWINKALAAKHRGRTADEIMDLRLNVVKPLMEEFAPEIRNQRTLSIL